MMNSMRPAHGAEARLEPKRWNMRREKAAIQRALRPSVHAVRSAIDSAPGSHASNASASASATRRSAFINLARE